MEFAQAFLTAAIEVVAIAGFGGILLHALHSSHCKWLTTYCPPVKPYDPAEETMQEEIPAAPTTQAAEEPIRSRFGDADLNVNPSLEPKHSASSIVLEQAIAQQQQAEDQPQPAQAQEEANAVAEKVVMLTDAEIDAAFKVPVLRALCDQHGIVWKDVRGKNKHALKPAMIQALISKQAFAC